MSEKIKYEILAVVILILAISLLVAPYMNSIEKNRDQAIAEYESDGGICYVDGVKQDDSFDNYGIDLDSYTVSYEEGKLYLKTKKNEKEFFPVFVPVR